MASSDWGGHTSNVLLRAALSALLLTAMAVPSAAAEGTAYPFSCNRLSLTADFADRDALSHSASPPSTWYRTREGRYLNGGWGPTAPTLPPVAVPADAGCDATTWMQERILSTALRYVNSPDNPLGLAYRHHHIPDWNPSTSTAPSGSAETTSPEAWGPGRGLDCSNFTAWVYNFGLGLTFGGNVNKQNSGTAGPMGRRLPAQGPFQPGDLIYLHSVNDDSAASHVVIYMDADRIIDSRGKARDLAGVQIRQRQGWYRTAVLGGWRPISG